MAYTSAPKLVEVGFTPAEALIAATQTTADAIGMAHEIGTIEVGKAADLVAFEGDPTTAVRAVSRVAAVILGGNRVVCGCTSRAVAASLAPFERVR